MNLQPTNTHGHTDGTHTYGITLMENTHRSTKWTRTFIWTNTHIHKGETNTHIDGIHTYGKNPYEKHSIFEFSLQSLL